MNGPREDEPLFLVGDYVTITRDARTRLVVAIGGDERAAGLLQTRGGFVSAAGPRGPYHRLPHSLAIEEQRQGATAAAHALLGAGFSVHLDPALNVLGTVGGDRQAAHRYLAQLAERARAADEDHEVAAVLSEIATPYEGLLPRLVETLIAAWAPWSERLRDTGRAPDPAHQLIAVTSRLSEHARRIEEIRNQAARKTAPPTTAPSAASVPSSSPSEPSVRRR
ncbi:hypothetical protein [Streptomyces sp. NPDC003077]|uniref:hypothetical protein n=1 Tax=Streptomyces sp. NPDC003077 TaxID=3154443 RepID=UPI0033B6F61C